MIHVIGQILPPVSLMTTWCSYCETTCRWDCHCCVGRRLAGWELPPILVMPDAAVAVGITAEETGMSEHQSPGPIRVTAAKGGAVAIELVEPEPFIPGPEGRAEDDARAERDAAALWLVFRRCLPGATLVRLGEHFRTGPL